MRNQRLAVQGKELASENEKLSAAYKALANESEALWRFLLDGVVTPLAHLVGMIAAAEGEQRRRFQGRLIQQVLVSAAELCGPSRETRAIFYRLDGKELVPDSWLGRADVPRTVYVDGRDRRGSEAHAIVKQDETLLIHDLKKDRAAAALWPADTSYRSFLAVSVSAGNMHFGLLTVDAVSPGTITEDWSLPIARVLARLLADGLVATRLGLDPTTDTTSAPAGKVGQ